MAKQGTRSARHRSAEDAEVLVHQWFEEHARRSPTLPAVVFGKTEWTYSELDVKSRRLAAHLRRLGAGPEVTVGLCFERSPELILTLLAILKAGAAYLPLDTRHPAARLRFMVQDASADIVVVQNLAAPYAADLKEATECLVALDDMDLEGPIRLPESAQVSANHQAYVIYTSGSTGQPKGAVLEHGGLANLIRAQQDLFGNGPGDRVLQFSPLSFDASLFEIVMALASGATLVMAPQDELLPGPGLSDLLRDKAITHLTIPPSVLAVLSDADLPDLQQVVVAGEACPPAVMARWSIGRRFYNAYGPTEATIWSTVAHCSEGQDEPTIGQAIPGVEVFVLGSDGLPTEDGEAGELCLAGVGLARGYLGRPALTAQSFIPHPQSDVPGQRLYRTGDLVRRLPSGDLDFVGRIDHQAKIHGRRIELGEIEACLNRHPDVGACTVVVREDVPGDRRLVAYVQAKGQGPAVSAWRAHLAQELPEYMVPSAFVVLETLPLTGSGKVDRDALPAPSGRRDEMGLPWVQPQGEVETRIAELMGALVGVDTVGAEDRFIELGGHSLLATQLAASLRDIWDVNVPLPRILEGATVAQLARMVEDGEGTSDVADDELPLVPMPRDGRIPLSFSQERIWYVHQINPDSLAYHASSVLIFEGHLQVDGLEWALTEIVRRHELLRTGFPTLDGEPCQDIHPAEPVRLPRVDLRHLPEAERADEAERLAMDEVRRLFDIAEPPLVRWTLLELSVTEHHLVQIEHHLIHDGWSFNVLLREIVTLYRAFVEGRANPLPELPVQFADFVLWQRQWMESEAAARQLDYWRQQLQDVPALELPTDRPRPPVQTFDGGVVPLDIPAPLATEVRNLARRQGATIFMMLFATFSALLHRWSGQRDFCIGSGVANRRQVETEPIIGMIINNLVLRVDLREDGDPDFAGFLAAMRRVTLDAYSRQDVPFDRIVEAVQPQRDASRNPLFQVAFSFHDAPLDDLDLPGVELKPRLALTAGSAKFDLNITSILPQEQRVGKGDEGAADGTVHMLWEYNSDLFDRTTVQRLVAAYLRFLQSAVEDPSQPLSRLPLLSKAQRHQVLVEWNDVQVPLATERLPHQLFEEHAKQRGDFLALWSKDCQWTYDLTNRRANRLARELVRLGVGPERPVALFTDGGPHLVLGMLAVLKAGGAFLPIDPGYPGERIRYLLEDSGAVMVLTRDPWIGQLPALQCPVLLLDEELGETTESVGAGDLEANLPCRTTPRSTAYMIYTSGSTGRPKGVQVEQRGLLNLIRWHQRYYDVQAGDRMTQVSSPAFDASIWEIWPYVTAGASLYFPGAEIRTSPAELVDFLQRHAINLCYASTPLAEAMLEEAWPPYVALRTLQTAGDALSRRPQDNMTFRLVNNYGPTENTVAATYCPVPPGEELGRPSIGRPLANVQTYVTDGNLLPVPLGAAGELLLGGLSLSRGYLDRPGLTAERFVPDPFSGEPGARLYRTGDRVRFRADGEIDFLGRMDHQVKVRGFRIELGEVEAAVLRHPSVREAVVLVRRETAGQRLVAYAVPSTGTLDGTELQAFLRAQLPGFMVPDDVVPMAEFPTTAHGKLDREALPSPSFASEAADHVAPRNDVEEQLARFCSELLDVPEVSVVDDFFRLGGNSLLATRLVSRVNQARSIKLPLSTFLQAPTLAELATAVEAQMRRAAEGADDAIRPLTRRHSQELLKQVDQMSAEDVEAMLAELQGSSTA